MTATTPRIPTDKFFTAQVALEKQIREVLRVVAEIQNHSKDTVAKCYGNFLLSSHNPEEREYPSNADQIREVLIHENYFSLEDIAFCLSFDINQFRTHEYFDGMDALHQSMKDQYAET